VKTLTKTFDACEFYGVPQTSHTLIWEDDGSIYLKCTEDDGGALECLCRNGRWTQNVIDVIFFDWITEWFIEVLPGYRELVTA
jgi:hypothetical protein